jgi:hypothetical protein
MMDSASPLEVWPIKEIMATVPVTKNHLHGRLYYLVKSTLRAVLRQFHRPIDQISTLVSEF